jgi:hypothetical protein
LRYQTPLKQASLVGQRPNQGQVGPEGAVLVAPGEPEQSELLLRISTRGSRRMPPLATSVVDREAVEVLSQWIRQMRRSGAD